MASTQFFSTPEGDQPKWKAPEVKPRIEDKAWDDSILLNAALMVFKEPLNGFTDDFADYFNQIPLAPAYYWTACFLGGLANLSWMINL